jgi:hypothetical protein
MIVLNEKCKKCHITCSAIHFQQNFANWTSDNADIDKFIQNTQLSAHSNYNLFKQVLEWIPCDRFYNIKYISEKKVYQANWIDGRLSYWSNEDQNWMRRNQSMIVILKRFSDPEDITLKYDIYKV